MPDVDNHAEEFEEVVDQVGSEYEAEGWDADAPGPTGERVSANSEGAGVGPDQVRGATGGDPVHQYSGVCNL